MSLQPSVRTTRVAATSLIQRGTRASGTRGRRIGRAGLCLQSTDTGLDLGLGPGLALALALEPGLALALEPGLELGLRLEAGLRLRLLETGLQLEPGRRSRRTGTALGQPQEQAVLLLARLKMITWPTSSTSLPTTKLGHSASLSCTSGPRRT